MSASATQGGHSNDELLVFAQLNLLPFPLNLIRFFALQWVHTPLKVPLPDGASAPPSSAWFFQLAQSHNPNGISIGSAVLESSRLWQTDRPKDRQTTLLGL